ncbi:MAG: sulfatase-like hydrolase/transferase [Gammaproteobacteria bacterium]|uniref:Sulfatase n=1 Tax=SAR86 cluster bacterium TaxID=2030880 RepID=A0A520MXD8_9GAMM|nr:sulfatase [Gammaproteobacteria bacterium]MBA4730019.1 sulfatase-like hydrolase/transferase [SAR86 cluster bacterium]RZO25898.1 MAG: sulfatase [SAR86 cluster bacterium]|tara:strand:- start:29949 stop:31568 length:1620 start_codon:yes stop_codon:yes gene_type:complete
MKKVVFGILIITGLGFIFWKEILFLILVQIAAPKDNVGPNQEVVWQQGPDLRDDGRPNIIVIVADDLGINDMTNYDNLDPSGTVNTPNIDFIANTGIKFKNAYSGSATCAPSRGMIVTGRYASSTGYEFTPVPDGMARSINLFNPEETRYLAENVENNPLFDNQGLPPEEITFAETLNEAGYYTAHIGKWHLGRGPKFAPLTQGFDESLMMASGLFMPENDPNVVNAYLPWDPIDKFLWAILDYAASFNESSERDNWFKPKGYLTDYYTDEAIKVIESNKNRPFFLYLAHWGVHTPLQALKSDYDELTYISDHVERVYAAMIKSLDRSVGRIVESLQENGLSENTWIIFTSDNGGAGYIGLRYINSPYRGWKLTLFEGGIRVPLIFWKDGIEQRQLTQRATHIDIMPTIHGLVDNLLEHEVDGIDLFSDQYDLNSRPIFWKTGHNKVVIKDNWKLQVADYPDKKWLYNLAEDPTEQIELSLEHPEKTTELLALIKQHSDGATETLYKPPLLANIEIDRTLKEVSEDGPIEDEESVWVTN